MSPKCSDCGMRSDGNLISGSIFLVTDIPCFKLHSFRSRKGTWRKCVFTLRHSFGSHCSLSAVCIKGHDIDILPDCSYSRIGGNCDRCSGSILDAVCFPDFELLTHRRCKVALGKGVSRGYFLNGTVDAGSAVGIKENGIRIELHLCPYCRKHRISRNIDRRSCR